MSQEASEETRRSWHRHFRPVHPEEAENMPTRFAPPRRPRDGYDFRRPVHSTVSEQGVIDLTNEPETPPQRTHGRDWESRTPSTSRLPRFGRDIMADVVNLEDEDLDDHGAEGPSSSPEVQFVRATVRPPQHDRWNPLPLLSDSSVVRSGSNTSYLWGVASHSSRRYRLPSLHFLDLGQPSALGPMDTLYIGGDDAESNANLPNLALGYDLSSFSMDSSHRPETRRRETYKPPSPAPPGFTHTLGEDDVAICPNCYWELGTGDGKKQEIWVAKQCGHVCYHQLFLARFFITDISLGLLR